MQFELALIAEQERELVALNEQLKARAMKFSSEFVPLTLSDYKMFKIKKASETGNIEYLDNILLQQIEDLQERKRKIKERVANFFPELKVQSDNKYFCQKEVPDFSQDNLVIRYNAWYLFGVDYMNNEKIRNYFSVNPHFKIEWINDSACNIAFNSKEEAEEALIPCLKGEGKGMIDQNQIWYQLKDYEVEGVMRKLFCRLATNKDVKKQEVHGHNSQYYRWVINKQKLGSYVKRTAQKEIRKTKPISRAIQEKHQKPQKFNRNKKEEQDSSSSGVEDSDDKMIDV